MNIRSLIVLLIFSLFVVNSCTEDVKEDPVKETKRKNYKLSQFLRLDTLNEPMGEPGAADWLYWKEEPGQTFKQYISSNPVVPSKKKNKIYILPIGEFSEIEEYVLNETAEYISIFFGLEVVMQEKKPTSIIPKSASRYEGEYKQLYTKYILYDVLLDNIQKDAVVYTAITSADLYPAPDWNFVFGQANVKKRVGVSSINRLIYKNLSEDNYMKFLRRIAKTSAHETCHMFGLRHCINYECMMNGSMHLQEADSRPFFLCPECLAKIIWCTKQDVNQRYDRLYAFFTKHGYTKEADFMKQSKELFNSEE